MFAVLAGGVAMAIGVVLGATLVIVAQELQEEAKK